MVIQFQTKDDGRVRVVELSLSELWRLLPDCIVKQLAVETFKNCADTHLNFNMREGFQMTRLDFIDDTDKSHVRFESLERRHDVPHHHV